MRAHTWIWIACLWAAVVVGLGAFAAHGLRADLVARGQLANWHTAVRYQMWHALALLAFGLWRGRHAGTSLPGWTFLFGSACFSGSIYGLAFGFAKPLLVPLTPVGGTLLIVGWLTWAGSAARAPGRPGA